MCSAPPWPGPLAAALDTSGAVLALLTIGILGFVLGTRASVHALTRKAGVGVQPLARGLRQGLGSLFHVGDAAADPPSPRSTKAVSSTRTPTTDDEPMVLGPTTTRSWT